MHLKNAENERNALPQGRTQQLVIQVVVPKKIYTYGESGIYIFRNTHIFKNNRKLRNLLV